MQKQGKRNILDLGDFVTCKIEYIIFWEIFIFTAALRVQLKN